MLVVVPGHSRSPLGIGVLPHHRAAAPRHPGITQHAACLSGGGADGPQGVPTARECARGRGHAEPAGHRCRELALGAGQGLQAGPALTGESYGCRHGAPSSGTAACRNREP